MIRAAFRPVNYNAPQTFFAPHIGSDVTDNQERTSATGVNTKPGHFTALIEFGMVVDTSNRNSNMAVKAVTYRHTAVYASDRT